MLNRFKALLYIAVLLSLFTACQKSEVKQIPVRYFFKTPDKSFFKISPDGKYITYLKPYKEKQNLFILSLTDGKERMATSFADYSVRDYFWTYNNHLVFSQDRIALDEYRMYALDINTLKLTTLISQEKLRVRLLNLDKHNPDVITLMMNKRNPASFDIYRLNIKTAMLDLYQSNPGNITEWFPDVDGKIRLAKSSDGVDETILFRPDDGAPFKPIIKNNFKNSVEPVPFTSSKNTFYALSNVNRDKMALVQIDAKTGKEAKVIYATTDADIQEVSYSRIKGTLEYAAWEDTGPKKHFLDGTIEQMYADIRKQLNNSMTIRLVDRDTAGVNFILNAYNDRNPGSYYLYNQQAQKLTLLGNINSSLSAEDLCVMKPVSFKASDGLLIQGYLTLPLNKKATNLPVVMMPHNDPWGRNVWGYNAEVQFLANRGYAVFQINYRGSSGYGKAFHSAGFKQVGGRIQQDVTDGVHWLIAQKIANPQKVAIMGSGFGGFSALNGVATRQGLYNCAIVQNGLINFFTYIKDAPPFFKPYLQMTYEMVGNPETDAIQLRNISPVFHTDKIKVPLLIFQGAKDPRANISELNQFVRELKKRNQAPVTYVLKENERGYFKSEHNRTQMYTQIEIFLADHMKVKP
jgi:dipeptidyl aminopeptidase/acylaminoacyl peptidase